jgi:hypothetical protein
MRGVMALSPAGPQHDRTPLLTRHLRNVKTSEISYG